MDVTARTTAYEALEESELRYRHLFKFMPISLWKLDVRRVVAMLNDWRLPKSPISQRISTLTPIFLPKAMDVIIAREVNEATVKMFDAKDQFELPGPKSPGGAKADARQTATARGVLRQPDT